MSDTGRVLDQIARIRTELNLLETLVKAQSVTTGNLVEPVTSGLINFANSNDLEILGGTPMTDAPDCCAVGNEEGYFCTGILIAPTLVVTAKHCVDITRVFFGTDINQPDMGETIAVTHNFPHDNPDVDVRVLVLGRAASAKPCHVAQGAEVGKPHTAIVAGFGNTDLQGETGYGLKRSATVPLVSLDSTSPTDQEKFGSRTGIELVAGHLGLHRDTCKGDSGGPLYITDSKGNGNFLLGVTSRGTVNAEHVCGDGGIYVRVDKFLDWIRTATELEVDGPLI